MRMIERLVLMVAVVIGLVPAVASAQMDGGGEMYASVGPTITVTGEGEVEVTPDTAAIELSVIESGPTAERLSDTIARSMARVLEELKKLDLPGASFTTTSVSVEPVYEGQSDEDRRLRKRPRLLGYRAESTVSVRTSGLGRLSEIIDVGTRAGANSVGRVRFVREDDREARLRSLALAVKDAREQAETIAQALGVEVVGLVNVGGASYGGGGYSVFESEDVSGHQWIEAGELVYSRSVTAVFRVSDLKER